MKYLYLKEAFFGHCRVVKSSPGAVLENQHLRYDLSQLLYWTDVMNL